AEREAPARLDRLELAAMRARALGEDDGRDAVRLDASAERRDLVDRLLRVVTVDQAIAAAPQIVRDARDAARQLALRDELGEVREEQVPQQGDVEHALVIRDDE